MGTCPGCIQGAPRVSVGWGWGGSGALGFVCATLEVPRVFGGLCSSCSPQRLVLVLRALLWLGLQIGVVGLWLLSASDVHRHDPIYAALG